MTGASVAGGTVSTESGGSSTESARWRRLDRMLVHRWWLLSMVAVTLLGRLSTFRFALSSDEGGFLYLADQWQAGGSSLYGDHWVDRPPLLVAFFAVADALGGGVALRVMGCGLAVGTVLLAHRIGGRLGGRLGAGLAAALATTGVTSPLFGAWQVDGELIAVPIVLAGVLFMLNPTARSWACAGALGAAALLVKQNFADVFIVAAVLIAAGWPGRGPGRETVRRAAAFIAGALAMVLMVLVLADQRGTSPSELWDAVVTFRGEASTVIAAHASSSTGWRLARLVLILGASGAGLVVAMTLARVFVRPRNPWILAAAALAGWEVIAILAGGSYWLHYLIGLVPAMVIGGALQAAGAAKLPIAWRWAVVMSLASTIVATGWTVAVIHPDEQTEAQMGQWLAAAADPGDTLVVLVGKPNIVHASGLDSPYRELWSLPVRVRDADLGDLVTVLEGPRAPTWLIVTGRSIDTWGVDATTAKQVARDRYRVARRMCGFTVLLHDGLVRDLPIAPRCGP